MGVRRVKAGGSKEGGVRVGAVNNLGLPHARGCAQGEWCGVCWHDGRRGRVHSAEGAVPRPYSTKLWLCIDVDLDQCPQGIDGDNI